MTDRNAWDVALDHNKEDYLMKVKRIRDEAESMETLAVVIVGLSVVVYVVLGVMLAINLF